MKLPTIITLITFTLVMQGCQSDVDVAETEPLVIAGEAFVKESGATLIEQARALYVINAISENRGTFSSAIINCRLNTSKDCERFLYELQRSVDAFGARKRKAEHCDDVCKIYRTADLLLKQDIDKLEGEVVVFSDPISRTYKKECSTSNEE